MTSKQFIPDIPLERVSRFVRQVTHDIRNGLNAIDLQAAFLSEIVPNEECRSEIRRLREMVGNVTSILHNLSGDFQEISLAPLTCSAKIFLEDAKRRLDSEFEPELQKVGWSVDVDDAQINIDLEAGFQAISELLRNALKYREPDAAILIESRKRECTVEVSVIEDKSSAPQNMQAWGHEPLINLDGRGYGLGLFRVNRVMKQLNCSVDRAYHSATHRLVTTIAIPLFGHG